MKEMTLRECCQNCGVSRRAVQGYEKAGLVQPTGKTERGYLLYDEQAQKRILEIKKYQSFGFQLKEIADYEKKSDSEKAAVLKDKYDQMVNRYEEMGEKIAVLLASGENGPKQSGENGQF